MGASFSITTGALVWLFRGGSLLGTMMTSIPLWNSIDPFRVMTERSDTEEDEAEGEGEVERMFEN